MKSTQDVQFAKPQPAQVEFVGDGVVHVADRISTSDDKALKVLQVQSQFRQTAFKFVQSPPGIVPPLLGKARDVA